MNYEFPDPECDLDYVPNESREKKVKIALSISAGFGGVNAAILFKKYEEAPLPFLIRSNPPPTCFFLSIPQGLLGSCFAP